MGRLFKKSSKYKVNNSQEDGLSLIEVMIALSVFLLLVPLLISVVFQSKNTTNNITYQNSLFTQYLCFSQTLQNDLSGATDVIVENNSISFTTPNKDSIKYFLRKKEIIKQVKKKQSDTFSGHIVLLRFVENVNVHLFKQILEYTVTLKYKGSVFNEKEEVYINDK